MTIPVFPHDERAEKTLLGIMLYDPDHFLKIHDQIAPEDFYLEMNKRLMSAFRDTYTKKGKVEYADIIEGKGGIPVQYLHECQELGELYRSSDWALRTVIETASKRKIQEGVLKITENMGERSMEDICSDLLDVATDARREKGKVYAPEELAALAWKEMENARESGTRIKGYRTGWPRVDSHIGGLQGKRITVISGPTGHGKSTTAMNWMSSVCINQGIPGLFITLEMKEEDVVNRILAIQSGRGLWEIESGRAGPEIIAGLEKITSSKLYVSDNRGRTVQDVALTIEKYAVIHKIKVWCLDYIGRLDRDNPKMKEDRDERFARWVKVLWGVTQRHNLHGLLVSQVNAFEQIAESKKIEHEADHSFFFKYVKEEGKHVLECRKNRFGPAWHKYLIDFDKATQRMTESGIIQGETTF